MITMELSRRFGGKRFIGDGHTYTTEAEAQEKAQVYREKGFQVELVAQDGRLYLFTRREIKEIVVEEKPS